MKEPKFETSATGGYVNPSKNSVKVITYILYGELKILLTSLVFNLL